MTTAVAEASDVPVWQLRDDALAVELQRLDQAIRVASARMVQIAAQAASRALPGQGGHRRLAGWVEAVLPTASGGQIGRIARLAQVLYCSPAAADLQPTRAALAAGQVSLEQGQAITTALAALLPPTVPAGTVSDAALSGAQTFLLTQASVQDPNRLTRLGQHLQARLDPDADQRLARDQHAQEYIRGLTLSPMGTGMVHLEGVLTPRCGAALSAAIDSWSAPHPASDGTPDPRSAAQRRHDGLQHLAEEAIARPGLLPATHGSPYQIVTTVAYQTLAATLASQSLAGLPPALLPDGSPLPSTTLAEIACTADLTAVLIDGVGNPLDVGHTQYAFPTRQRTAITVRDRHCTYPGCTAPPPWCDIHHLTPFNTGGRTAVTNGTLLCSRHHRRVHTTHQTGHLTNGTITWTTAPHQPPDHTLTRATRALDHLTRRWTAVQRT